VSKNQI